ncbi:MAG TPA: 30S ribosomal protein S2 [Elusimicrobiales bacterium]|nr:30S ribosomal protein S2 [Elusimicrobiales bacterium]
MQNISMKAMLEAGVHFGHQTSRWNPKMARYIFGARNGIHILDLQKTVKEIKKVYAYVVEKSKGGARFLFVGTKKQAKDVIREESQRADVASVYEKWLGGTLTNFATIQKSIKRLEELEKWEEEGLFKAISKKELSRLTKEKDRLVKLLTGIRKLKSPPDIMFLIDPVDDAGAVKEAKILHIPVVAVCDTNCDPDLIDIPIPGNDDAARSIKLFCSLVADAIIEGRQQRQAEITSLETQMQEQAEKEESQTEETSALGEETQKPVEEVKEETKEPAEKVKEEKPVSEETKEEVSTSEEKPKQEETEKEEPQPKQEPAQTEKPQEEVKEEVKQETETSSETKETP